MESSGGFYSLGGAEDSERERERAIVGSVLAGASLDRAIDHISLTNISTLTRKRGASAFVRVKNQARLAPRRGRDWVCYEWASGICTAVIFHMGYNTNIVGAEEAARLLYEFVWANMT